MKAVSSRSWQSLLRNNDAATLWHSLNQLVSLHPLIRSARRNPAKSVLAGLSLPDLTQDLYLQLLQKSRFDHYLTSDMSDAEIEKEIFQIELTNMLIGRLRQRQPENYRVVRRIGQVLQGCPQFRVVRSSGDHPTARYGQTASAIYGLREWNDKKPIRGDASFDQLISEIPARIRNRRRSGCKGDSQLIVSNLELTELLVEILRAVDSPLSVKVLRSLALSRLPVCDPIVSSLDHIVELEEGAQPRDWILATEVDCPERVNLRREAEEQACRSVRDFLSRLDRMARFKPARAEKLWRILWHHYFDSDEPSQIAIAARLGMSDSSVSGYRLRMEREIQKLLGLTCSMEDFVLFADELSDELGRRIGVAEAKRRRRTTRIHDRRLWPGFDYSSLLGYENRQLA